VETVVTALNQLVAWLSSNLFVIIIAGNTTAKHSKKPGKGTEVKTTRGKIQAQHRFLSSTAIL
jgi:hypothetical protein